MAITREEVVEVARLARLELAEDEIQSLAADLGAILGFMAKLGELDTRGVEPTTHAVPLACPLREDVAGPSLAPAEALAAAPQAEDGHFVVPPILEVGEPTR
jgi:aspartyl-tRNA(Asn)/glutamyl-tRNA(Gln) amidotransferase subunit C